MTPTLVRNLWDADPSAPADAGTRARDWAEIQERMLAPLYEAVYDRLEVGPATRMLSLGCGSGLALLVAAARGAQVTGVDSDRERLALARERLLPDESTEGAPAHRARLHDAGFPSGADGAPYDLITVFEPIGCAAGDSEGLVPALEAALPLTARGATVVLTGWGPPERCATAPVLRVAARLTESARPQRPGGWRPTLRDDLEDVAGRAGLKPDGSGRVSCPFGYADPDSAVRGLLSTGLFDAAVRATDRSQVEKEVAEALHPYRRPDGTVWMPNVFRYLVCTT
ncbi:class I SAM-dependent methyltransferase [Streptomyces sp. CA-146814]|uniref:class I SAM-dependent methyltransferase n=1 Tax=Streptomyces sp. CA-146814 TaxID=3240053 RepID=UPI003D8C0683